MSRSRRSRARPIYNRRSDEFYWLWIVATAAYGVGDVVTTIALVYFVPHLSEGNPIVRLAMDTFGLWGLVAAKLVAFLVMVWISYLGARDGDAVLYYFPPALLTVVGVTVTAVNLRLLFA
ncbi:putative membrane protein [Halalkaliarchaeum sp. AArc-CO]|uniref:hypothetical protein n=1 Tax=unclassified Halalkaliarchaeum TaxID=2678344 RepID=UPI00217DFCD0|nr:MULTISPECIES: hypothetical protein [unclassified Halalkaliarchaeum]MDR5671612.1 hypothetical protein [Halalkaliarchaeum sp. AArc-GB]UWG51114.1 putative membrane protein [Halalkaliarchaeum sp. AArc-CO]